MEHVVESAQQAGFLTAFKRPAIRTLAVSRAVSKLAQAAVAYGAMVYLAGEGGSQWQISLLAATTYLSAVLFGVQGGLLADSMSKRVAIALGFAAIAASCVLIPIFWGTDVTQLLVMMFIASALMQVISPSLKAAVAIVANPEELATVSASVSVAGSIASAIGSSFLAPLLIKTTGIRVLLFVAAGLFLLGAVRVLKLPEKEQSVKFGTALRSIDWRPTALSLKETARWLVEQRAVAAVILVGAIAVSIFEAFNTLIPVYVRDVLKVDPTDAIYIFAPAGIGFLIGTFLTPKLIHIMGPRKLAVFATVVMSVCMVLFGLVNTVAPVLAPMSPLRILGSIFSIDISDRVLAASFIALPANFGSTAAGAAVQTFINARVPIVRQGATFGLQEVQENVFTLALVLLLGGISSITGPRVVFILAPIVAAGLVLSLIRYSYREQANQELTFRQAFDELTSGDEGAGTPTGSVETTG